MPSRYKKILDILKDGDIILIENTERDFVDDGIEWFTDSRWCHAVWYYNKYIYHWTRWTARRNFLKRYLKKQYKLCIMRYPGMKKYQIINIRAIARHDVKEKKKYGKKPYLGFALFNIFRKLGLGWLRKYKNPWREYDKRECSTGIVQRWFKKAGIILCSHLGEEQVTPQDIRECKKLQVIYLEVR